jgi:hypothetical protein
MKTKRDIILKMQKEMAEHKDMAGDCDYCPKHAYMRAVGENVYGDSCLEECEMVLKALGLEPTVPSNDDEEVYCDDFFYWFLDLKVGKQRKAIKI